MIFHRNKEMSVEGSYVGMKQLDHDDTTAKAKLHTESFKLLVCYKVAHTWFSNPFPRFLLPVTSQVAQPLSLG